MQNGAVIKNIKARKVFNGRGSPTIEIEISATNSTSRAGAPSGASTGMHEVVSYPQGGVEEAIMLMNDVIAPQLLQHPSQKNVSDSQHCRIFPRNKEALRREPSDLPV